MAGFQIHILRLQWPDLGSRYRLDQIWPQLSKTDLEQAALVLSEQDFRGYDWERQELWLNPQGMARVGVPEHEALLRDSIGRAFVVTLQGQRLYGGLFYPYDGAAGIRFPVMYPFGQPIEFLQIRPGLGEPWAPEHPLLAARCQVIAVPALATWLAETELLCRIPDDRRPPELNY